MLLKILMMEFIFFIFKSLLTLRTADLMFDL